MEWRCAQRSRRLCASSKAHALRVVAQARVSDIGVLCSLLAAAAHDYAHPARTNAFLVSTKVRSRARLLTAACAAARVRYSRAQLGSKARRSASAARTGQAPLAIRYNDKSVLESMHSAELFTIMQDADCNVLATLPEDQQRLVRAKARPAAVRCGVLIRRTALLRRSARPLGGGAHRQCARRSSR